MKKTLPTQWDFALLFQSEDDPKIQAELDNAGKLVQDFVNKWSNRADYLKDARILKHALDEYEPLGGEVGPVGNVKEYFELRLELDANNTELKARFSLIEELSKDRLNAIRFFPLKLATIPLEKQKELLKDETLKEYKHYLEVLFENARYNLSPKEESIIADFSQAACKSWVQMLLAKLSIEKRDLKIHGDVESLTINQLINNLKHQDETIRDSSAKAFNSILHDNLFMAEREFNSFMECRKVVDNLRGYERPDQIGFVRDEVDSESIDVFLNAVESSYDISREFYHLKAQALGKKQIKDYEKNIGVGSFNKKFSWEEIADIVSGLAGSLDREFKDIVDRLIYNGHVDVFPKEGKTGGAYCTYGAKDTPQYILMNLDASVRSLITFAHETGHAIHHDYFNQNQNRLNARGSKFTAEVSSTFMESFAYDYVFKLVKDDTQQTRALLFEKLSQNISGVFRQVAGFKFEQEAHREYRKNGYLSHEVIGELFQKHMRAYIGDAVNMTEGSQNWWVPWPHFRIPFQVYSYATGDLIARSLKSQYDQNPLFIDNIKDYFKDGLYRYPREQFARMGVDITDKNFWLNGIDEIRKDLEVLKKLS